MFFSAALWNCDIRLDSESLPKILGAELVAVGGVDGVAGAGATLGESMLSSL